MSLIDDAAGWFKDREIPIRRWHRDDGGRYAFRVTVDGTHLTAAALSRPIEDGVASAMKKVVQRAADLSDDALLCVFIDSTDDVLVWDPQKVLQDGWTPDPNVSIRQARGEDWVRMKTDWAVDILSWYDWNSQPTQADPSAPDVDGMPARDNDITAWTEQDGDTDG